VTATVDMFPGGRSNYNVGRLRIGIFSRKLGRGVLTLLSSCGAYARYSVCHTIGCLFRVISNNITWLLLGETCKCIVIKLVLGLFNICTYVYQVFMM
jgi:hypothetical protein